MSDLYDPNAGGVGFLTWDQFDRFRNATENSRQYVPWLRVAGYLKSGTDPDEHRTRSARSHMPLGLPATWLAAEEITQLMQEINRWNTLEDVAKFGSEFALMLTREVETAMAKWPLHDRSRDVKYFRCQACQQMTLRYYPPTTAGEQIIDSTVKCTNPTCRAIVDEIMFARMALLIEAEQKEANERARQLGKGKGRTGSGPEIEADGVPVGEGQQGADDATPSDPVAVPA